LRRRDNFVVRILNDYRACKTNRKIIELRLDRVSELVSEIHNSAYNCDDRRIPLNVLETKKSTENWSKLKQLLKHEKQREAFQELLLGFPAGNAWRRVARMPFS
jgi:hypothetical protein